MALLTSSSSTTTKTTKTESKKNPSKGRKKQQINKPPPSSSSSSSWDQFFKNLLTCKQVEGSRVHDPSKTNINYSKLQGSCRSICNFRDVVAVHSSNTARVVHRADITINSSSSASPDTTTNFGGGQETRLLTKKKNTTHGHGHGSSSFSSSSSRSLMSSSARSNNSTTSTYTASSKSGMQFRKLSGCYECHTVLDATTRYNLVNFLLYIYIYTYQNNSFTDIHCQEQRFVLALTVERSSQRLKAWSIIKQ